MNVYFIFQDACHPALPIMPVPVVAPTTQGHDRIQPVQQPVTGSWHPAMCGMQAVQQAMNNTNPIAMTVNRQWATNDKQQATAAHNHNDS